MKNAVKANVAVFHPSLLSRGGSQRYAIATVVNLRNSGVRADLITSKYLPMACYPELLSGTTVHALETYQKSPVTRSSFKSRLPFLYASLFATGIYALLRLVRDWRVNRKMAEFIVDLERRNGMRYDVIYLHEASPFNWLAKYFNGLGRRTYLFCYDTPDKSLAWEIEGLTFLFMHEVVVRMAAKFDVLSVKRFMKKVFVLDSTMEEKALEYYGVKPFIIHGGIDLEAFNPTSSDMLRHRYGLSTDHLVVSNVTRFVPYRRVHDLFEAIAILPDIVQSQIYIYINAADEDEAYTRHLKNQYAEYLHPIGNIIIDHELTTTDSELASIYQSSDAFIFPNENQTWGNAVLEAMACGTCVLVSDSCGISEIVKDGENGFVFSCGDIDAIAEFLTGLVNDGDKYTNCGVNAGEYVKKNLSWDVWTTAHITHLEI